MRLRSTAWRHRGIGIGVIAIVALAAWLLSDPPPPAQRIAVITAESDASQPDGPPWLYGRPDARFTVIAYADLQCPYCRTSFPILRQWIDKHPEVNWQWRHMPLAMHEPAATTQARIAECAGQTGGHAAFWEAVAWLYAHPDGDAQGLSQSMRASNLMSALLDCLRSDAPDAVIRIQAMQATQRGISGTPTLELRDRQSGNTLVLRGQVEGDALLSALDLLSSGDTNGSESSLSPDMRAGPADVMPR